MSLAGQRVDPSRYSLIPRTLSFLIRENQVLLVKLGAAGAGWRGLYNGLGGHVEQGEDPLSAAVREVQEESGLHVPDQRLCGVVAVDTGSSPGIGLYVYVAELPAEARAAQGDELKWVPLDGLEEHPLVADLPTLLPAAVEAFMRRSVFSASYNYAPSGTLQISFA